MTLVWIFIVYCMYSSEGKVTQCLDIHFISSLPSCECAAMVTVVGSVCLFVCEYVTQTSH